MCIVSYVGEAWEEKWRQPFYVPFTPEPVVNWNFTEINREEFEALKADVEELKRLLINAKELDKVTNQPDCEMEEKVAIIRKVADAVGVDLEEIFGK